MKLIILITIATSLLLTPSLEANPLSSDSLEASQYQKDAKAKIKLFASTLKLTLKAAIKEGGFENAVKACSETAPEIAATLSVDGWTMGRVSLKARNPANKPDTWEKEVLIGFLAQKDNGAKVKTLQKEIIQKSETTSNYRFMKAIPTAGLCLACHGKTIDPELSKVIASHYPEDTATGYQLGDIRGAFTLSKKIEN